MCAKEGTAHKRVSTQPNQTTHPALVAGEATLWRGRPWAEGQQQQQQQQAEGQHLAGWLVLLSSSGATHPACRSPWNQCFVDLSLFSADWGLFSAQPAAVCFVFLIYAYLKPVPHLPSYSSGGPYEPEQSVPAKVLGTGFNPFIKTSVLFLCQSGFAPTWGCMCLPRSSTSCNYAKQSGSHENKTKWFNIIQN